MGRKVAEDGDQDFRWKAEKGEGGRLGRRHLERHDLGRWTSRGGQRHRTNVMF